MLWKGEKELEAGQVVGVESQCRRLWPQGNEFVRTRPLQPGGMNRETSSAERSVLSDSSLRRCWVSRVSSAARMWRRSAARDWACSREDWRAELRRATTTTEAFSVSRVAAEERELGMCVLEICRKNEGQPFQR